MAGRPPTITEHREGSYLTLSFNECPSVPYGAVQSAFKALSRADLVSRWSSLSVDDGIISIRLRRPPRTLADRRSSVYRAWRQRQLDVIHGAVIGIQSGYQARRLVRHITSRAAA